MIGFLRIAGLALGFAATNAAQAATITLVSMQYSAAHPVPHLHYEGETVSGDVEALEQIYRRFVRCRIECIGENGSATAVLTLNGPGGSYGTGLALADFLRANHIATVIERGDVCYSACAFAFLGGTGYSSFDRIGSYVDRMIEPGAILGFHAPYYGEEALRAALEERSPSDVLGENRSSISLMVHELVKWNVDPEIVHYMVSMGPDETYDIVNADDYYMVRSALPPTPSGAWIADIESAVKNACLRLLALYERSDPLLLEDRITTPYEHNIASNATFGPLSGYRLSDNLLDLGHCSVTEKSVAEGNLQIALYMNPGISGSSEPLLSFFNNDAYFTTAGIGGGPLKRVFQKGGINHWFLPVGVPVDELDQAGALAILANKFFTITQPALPSMLADLVVEKTSPTGRVSSLGDVFVFEQVGNNALFDAALANPGRGVTYSTNSVSDTSFVRAGSYDASGQTFAWFGFVHGDAAAVVRVEIIKPEGETPTSDELDLVNRIECAAEFQSMRLDCGT